MFVIMNNLRGILKYLILSIFILSNSLLYGYQSYSFKHYNINNGLSQNTVLSIFQDSQGFMWFGTKDGLNRFDGASFKTFKFSPDEILRDNVFHHILEDKDGNIWVATEDGIYIYNPYLEVFDRLNVITEDNISLQGWISDLIQDNDGDMWITVEGKGAFHYGIVNKKLTYYPISYKADDGMRSISACIGSNNDVWVFPYGSAPTRIDKETGQISHLHLLDDPTLFDNLGEITNVISDGKNQLILPTSNKGLISINTSNKTHKILLSYDSFGEPVFARTVRRIDSNTIWVGTESGLYIINTLEGTVENLRHSLSVPTSLSDNAIYSIFKDKEGGVWIGSYFGGVDYYSEQLNRFELFYPTLGLNNMTGSRIREFCSASDGNIWIGTEDKGLHLFNPESKTFLPLPAELSSLYTNIHALYNDGDYLWISTFSKGLNRYNQRTKEIVTYVNTSEVNSISQNSPFSIIKDSNGMLWIGTLSGLNIYNYEDDSFTRIDQLKGVAIQDIFEDNLGRIWVATFSNGLYRFDRLKGEWSIYTNNQDDDGSLPYNKVTSVYQDSKDRIWVTTQGGGFSQYIEGNDTFVTINSVVGMPNDVVYQIVEDNNYNLWLSTNYGLVCYNPQLRTFRNYTVENGLRTNQFNYKSSYKQYDGTIYFGSLDGFVRFNPSSFTEPGNIYPIVLTSLSINNNIVDPINNRAILSESIIYVDRLVLPHNNNSISLEYAVLNYSNQIVNQVIYKLEGFDNDWIYARGNNIVYSNLKPGKYTLSIKLACDMESDNIKTLLIHIKPPFWFTGWAYLLYSIISIIIVYALIRSFRSKEINIRKKKMQKFEQEKERELYKSKIDFFTNVAHEIRTPLSLIKAPLDYVLMSERLSDETKDNLFIMSKNTDRLLNLTNQLLDFQKTEVAAYSLNIFIINVSELIRETYLRFTSFAKQREVEFELDLPEVELYAQLDKEAFIKIISNLISNAIKFCDNVVLIKADTLEKDGEILLQVVVENDGDVIPIEYRKLVFAPFFHINRQKDTKVSGTGIGLALSRSFAELHKGTLIYRENDKLNSFMLTIPVGDISEAVELKKEEKLTTLDKNEDNNILSDKTYSILLVDDDKELLTFEAKVLSSQYNVLVAENGKEALEVLEDNTVNLIISDVMMPEMDGFELTHNVKSNIEFSHIPVILLTAKTNVQSKVKGFESGADSYIEKPFSIEILMAQTANLLQSREKLRETFHKHPFIGANSVAFTKSDEEFIKKMNSIVQENIDNADFVVEDIAEHFNMSRASFYRKIKGILDLTPSEYIRIERLKKAAILLKEKEFKVNEVCYMVGFNSPSYFAKCFHKQFGVLPKDF